MKPRQRVVILGVPALLCLGACQSLYPDAYAMKVVPTEQVRHGTSTPEALYALGRYHQGQVRYDLAIGAYTRLLADYPDHVEARNALGIIFATQGRHEAAIRELERAAANAPDSASIHNNLGYAYMLRGNVTEAVAALEIAARLDPNNRRVQENLALALGRDGNGERASVASAVAADAAAGAPAAAPGQPTSPTQPKPPTQRVEQPRQAEGIQLIPVKANVFALQLPAPARRAAATPETKVPAATRGAGKEVRLEISNGNGITGLARETSGQLQGVGYARARLTNALPYRLATTEIQYRPGFEFQARDLQATLRTGIPLVASSQLRPDVQVRLLLGKDVSAATEVLAQRPVTEARQLAAIIP